MALVRKTEKLKNEIHENIEKAFIDKAKQLFKKHDALKTMRRLLACGWEHDYLIPAEVKRWLENVDPHELSELAGFCPVKVAVRIDQASEHGWKQLLELNETIATLYPALKSPRLLYCSEEGTARMAYASRPQYDHIDPYNEFIVGFKLPLLEFGDIQNDGTWELKERGRPISNTRYGSTKASDWFQIMPDKMRSTVAQLPANSLARKPFNDEMVELIDTFDYLEADIRAALERSNKTTRYIFGELWKLPSLNKMYEFFPAIRAFIDDDTLKRLEKGGRKRPTYNISMPDEDVVVGATEASIRK